MQAVCGKKRVEPADAITKSAAEAPDTGVGQGTQRPLIQKTRRWADACFFT